MVDYFHDAIVNLVMAKEFFMKQNNIIYNNIDNLSNLLLGNNLKLHASGHQKDDPTAVCDTRVIDDYELIYTIAGTTLITLDNICHELHSGDLFLIQPFLPHKIDTLSTDLHENHWIHFDLQPSISTDNFIRDILLTWNSYTYHLGIDSHLLSLLATLEQEVTANLPGSFLVQNALLSQLLIYIIRTTGVHFSTLFAENPHSLITTQLLNTCYREFLTLHSVKELADQANISISYCNQLFDRELRISPTKFLLLLRLKEGARLLRQTDFSIVIISEKTNFASPYHFSNVFKKYYGASPTQYRNMNFNC